MKYGKTACLLLFIFGFAQAIAQEPDFYQEKLKVVKGQTLIGSAKDAQASVSLYSFEEYLSLVVEVKDDYKDINAGEYLADHVELFFALPLSAFPQGFENEVHPYYIYAPPPLSRGDEQRASGRLFSSQDSKLKEMEVSRFLDKKAYPGSRKIQHDSLGLPLASQLLRKRIDYGIVHYGLFLDGRKPILYNKKYHQILENDLHFRMGALESGITYVIDHHEDGYTLTAQIEPEALGFVQLPEMKNIRFSLDVIDTDGIEQEGFSVLSVSGGGSHSMKDRSFLEVNFQRPLQTNFSDTPDRVYKSTGFFPTFTYTETGWAPTAVDVDALFYKNKESSDQLSEVRFLARPQSYQQKTFPQYYLSVEQLSIIYDYVNLLGCKVNYTLLNGQVFRSQRMRVPKQDTTHIPEMQIFFFPDEKPGLILAENASLSPYGWGDQGHALDERIRILRIGREQSAELLRIEQGEGEPGYCHIGQTNYEGFFVEKINWAVEGHIMVLLLKNRINQSRKRLRISWLDDGSQIEIQELP